MNIGITKHLRGWCFKMYLIYTLDCDNYVVEIIKETLVFPTNPQDLEIAIKNLFLKRILQIVWGSIYGTYIMILTLLINKIFLI